MTILEAARNVVARMGHLKRYQTEMIALREAIAAHTRQTTVEKLPINDRPIFARLMPAPEPSETFLEKVARLEQEALEKQTK